MDYLKIGLAAAAGWAAWKMTGKKSVGAAAAVGAYFLVNRPPASSGSGSGTPRVGPPSPGTATGSGQMPNWDDLASAINELRNNRGADVPPLTVVTDPGLPIDNTYGLPYDQDPGNSGTAFV